MQATRRGFIFGLTGIFAAPAVIKASSLMPISALAPEMVSDPLAVGTLLEETSRSGVNKILMNQHRISVCHPDGTLLPSGYGYEERPATFAGIQQVFDKPIRHEKVVALGNGYEAGYIRKEGDRLWRLGFLDDERYGHNAQAREYELKVLRAGRWQRAMDEASDGLSEQRRIEAMSRPDSVPAGLKRHARRGAGA